MTREEAINRLKGLYGHRYSEQQEEALDMAIKALEARPSEDAISRERLKEVFHKNIVNGSVYDDLIDAQPPVNPQPKTGHWIEVAKHSDGRHEIKCSECESHIFDRGHANSYVVKEKYKYCPNCGAKMV